MTNRGLETQTKSLSASLFSAGLDFLTATSDSDNWGYDMAEMVSRETAQIGSEPYETSLGYGYKGWGDKNAIWAHNKRLGRFLTRLSGPIAEKCFGEVIRPGPDLRVTRLDLYADVKLNHPNENIAKYNFLDCKKILDRKYTFIEGQRGAGQTLYVGSRTSSQFGRLYDKAAQDKRRGLDPGALWRYEVELKSPIASRVAERLLIEQDLPAYAVAFVSLWFTDRGVGFLYDLPDDMAEIEVPSAYEPTDESAERSLWWLKHQVRGTIKRLESQGHLDEAKEALGLIDPGLLDGPPGQAGE